MFRLIHAQTVQGGILVDDIDDGLPNKKGTRLSGDPKAYTRDGYADAPKQKCYVPYSKVSSGTTVAGFIDIKETDRVTLSNFKGKILKLKNAGLVTVTHFTAANVALPTLTLADKDTPGAGDLTLTGTNFVSLLPDFTSVIITGSGAITLTSTQIVAGGGTVGATSIFIPAALVPGIATGTSSAQVRANNQLTAIVALS